MMRTEDLFILLERRRVELGLSQSEVGRRAFGQTDGSALQNLRRGSSPTFEKLQRLCEVLGLEVSVSAPGAAASCSGNDLCAPVDESDYARIPLVDAALSAGPGRLNGDADVVGQLVFRRDWLRKLKLQVETAVLARVSGDSMAPTLESGDTVLIDTSAAARNVPVRARPPGKGRAPIYALRTEGEARVKRLLRPDPETILVLSDNPDWPPEAIGSKRIRQLEIEVIGRVVWWGHTVRD